MATAVLTASAHPLLKKFAKDCAPHADLTKHARIPTDQIAPPPHLLKLKITDHGRAVGWIDNGHHVVWFCRWAPKPPDPYPVFKRYHDSGTLLPTEEELQAGRLRQIDGRIEHAIDKACTRAEQALGRWVTIEVFDASQDATVELGEYRCDQIRSAGGMSGFRRLLLVRAAASEELGGPQQWLDLAFARAFVDEDELAEEPTWDPDPPDRELAPGDYSYLQEELLY